MKYEKELVPLTDSYGKTYLGAKVIDYEGVDLRDDWTYDYYFIPNVGWAATDIERTEIELMCSTLSELSKQCGRIPSTLDYIEGGGAWDHLWLAVEELVNDWCDEMGIAEGNLTKEEKSKLVNSVGLLEKALINIMKCRAYNR